MPVLAPQGNTPYDTVDICLNFARIIANDAGISIAGDLLSDAQPATLPYLCLAWRELQDALIDNGVEVETKEAILTGFPPNTSQDPADLAYIGYAQSFDGQTFWQTPVLPPDLLVPLELWQRQTGTMDGFTRVQSANDGLQSGYPLSYINAWEWRGDGIYTNGALLSLDFRIRYSAYFNDFVLNQDGSFPGQVQIPILRSAPALAYYVVSTFIRGRGADADIRAEITSKGIEAIQKLVNRTARKKQRGNHRRQPYSMGTGSGSGFWNGW